MISSWKCFFIIVLKILLVTADQIHEASPSYLVTSKDICYLPPDKGVCSLYYHRWYYNRSKNECDLFVYSGCGGNDNRFDFFNDCYKLCIKKADVTTRNDSPPTSDPTNYTIYLKPGREGEASPDWKNLSSDENTGVTAVDNAPPTTVETDYNRRFIPHREVETTTDTRRNLNADICNQPKDSGYCLRGRYYLLRWYYDNYTNSCKLFYYYGCGRNDNRFYNLQDCQQQCVRDETTTDFLHPNDGQMGTSDYIYPGIRTKDWKSSTGTVDRTDWEKENGVVIDVPTYQRGDGIRNRIIRYTLAIAFVSAVLIFVRMAIANYRHAEQDEQLLTRNDEAGRTSSSDDNSSPLRVSVCVISLRDAEQQSSDESTADYEMPKSDSNSSEAPPAYYPPHPPPYEP